MQARALAEAILSVVLDAAGNVPVRKVEAHVGALHGAAVDSLRSSFKSAAKGTLAQGAELNIRRTFARMRCNGCGAEGFLRKLPFQCALCESTDVVVIAGDDVKVEAVELENGCVVRHRAVPLGVIFEHL